jgi:hypothetical protein
LGPRRYFTFKVGSFSPCGAKKNPPKANIRVLA